MITRGPAMCLLGRVSLLTGSGEHGARALRPIIRSCNTHEEELSSVLFQMMKSRGRSLLLNIAFLFAPEVNPRHFWFAKIRVEKKAC
jgi:hypothetical protein